VRSRREALLGKARRLIVSVSTNGDLKGAVAPDLSSGCKPFVRDGDRVLITGGAGFIGCNAAARFLGRGAHVIVIDNFSREGAAKNVAWLRRQEAHLEVIDADVRDGARMLEVFASHRDAALVLHLAGQVSVTGSISDPRADFDVNAAGTLNLLEAMRTTAMRAPLIYASTNKVYGGMPGIPIEPNGTRYMYVSPRCGIAEEHPLDFHSPYACSKGAADQYVRDYHRIYGLNTVVFRQSCIYGTHQFGAEEQGWVAWFAIAAHLGRPITLFGDGKQVRDILFAEDLVDAFEAAAANIDAAAGGVFNIGGGPENAVSLIDVLEYLKTQCGRELSWRNTEWRPGDQKIYVSDIRRAQQHLGWTPRTHWHQGVSRLVDWVVSNRGLFE
jgi:CDP-paratose 2-epimerase